MKCSTVVAQRYYAQMNDTKKQILTEISEVDCCFGTAVRYALQVYTFKFGKSKVLHVHI